jgi:AraC-like DNA-binding protein
MGRGVLRPDLAAAHITLDRHQPSALLAPFVDYYWVPRWDLRGEPPYEQAVLPHPNVHLVFEASGAGIFGVDRRLFTRTLSGLGLAFGVRFRAGCFRPFWQAPISQLTDRVIPAVRLFGSQAEKTRQAIMNAGVSVAFEAGAFEAGAFEAPDEDDARMVGYAEALLCSVLPERDPVAEQVAMLVSRITDDPGLRRVDELSASSGLTARTLQRLFADYVGVSPKWVMRRARLHEAAERADSGEPVDWAVLAADLGYADQAHLTRDFTVTIGVPPSRYAAPVKDGFTALPAWSAWSAWPAGTVRRFSGGRSRAPARASLMSLTTAAGSERICLGVKRSTTIWCLPMRRPRASVFAWSAGDRCHSRESTSMAMPSSGHHASGLAMNVPSLSYSAGLNSGIGIFALTSRSLRSASATDRIPSATSASASRNSAEPTFGPAASSAARSWTRQARCCTASATTARTSRRLDSLRTVSATARAGGTYRIRPTSQIRSGSRVVRCSRTNAASCRCRVAGTRTSIRSGLVLPMRW